MPGLWLVNRVKARVNPISTAIFYTATVQPKLAAFFVGFFNCKICLFSEELISPATNRDGRMSRSPASRSGRLGNPKLAGSNLDLAVSNPG